MQVPVARERVVAVEKLACCSVLFVEDVNDQRCETLGSR